jgi:hypothetical protein
MMPPAAMLSGFDAPPDWAATEATRNAPGIGTVVALIDDAG